MEPFARQKIMQIEKVGASSFRSRDSMRAERALPAAFLSAHFYAASARI
jgi:hypothetical protein